ncbi:hypothetical protein TNCV_615201 [Trichonephila clavipes]|nr:hypothetical protein TNCV_615201 [Trichonephila clavipes]
MQPVVKNSSPRMVRWRHDSCAKVAFFQSSARVINEDRTRDLEFRKNASQAAEIVNGVYGVDTVTTYYGQFWFDRFHSGISDVKDAPRTGRLVIVNVDKITEIIEVEQF